jgi:hypothetical protein
MELNKIEIVVKKYFDGETSVEEEKRVTKVASTDVASHLMQYKSILDIYLMLLRKSQTRTCSAAKLQYKKQYCYGYQLPLQFFVLLSAGMYVYVDRDVSRPWNV